LSLDEPTTGLDPKSRGGLWEVVRELVAEGTTVLLTTQYLEEADQLADSIAVIDTGRVIASGSPSQLKQAVGGRVLRLSPALPEAAEQLVQLAEWAVGVKARSEDGAVIVPVAHAGEAQAVMARIGQAGVDLAAFGLHDPTLDEVFLQLTGHRTTHDDARTKEPAA
jgi:ABC-type multidrug transport system ATPase subunit